MIYVFLFVAGFVLGFAAGISLAMRLLRKHLEATNLAVANCLETIRIAEGNRRRAEKDGDGFSGPR